MIERIGSQQQQNVYTTRQWENENENTIENSLVKEHTYDNSRNLDNMDEVIESINAFLQPSHTSLKFELHEKLNDYYVQVIDDNTKEVVREIPSKKVLDMYASMKEFMGLMIDEKI